MSKIKKILKVRRYKAGYIVQEELRDGTEYGCKDFTMKVAYNHQGDYIGDPKSAYRLCKKLGIKPEIARPDCNVCSIGFCEKEQKWYGWSHRAIYGFGIGSKVKPGNCGYTTDNVRELYDNITQGGYIDPKDAEMVDDGVMIRHKMGHHTITNPDGSLGGWVEDEPEYRLIKIGRGEWEAKTLEDAKQMAIDFASGVS